VARHLLSHERMEHDNTADPTVVPRPTPSDPPPACLTRHVTLVFSDVVGFTEMTESLGNLETLQVMRRYRELVRSSAREHAGEELELRGDGFLLAFDRPSQAIACALSIQALLSLHREHAADVGVHARIGVHSGPALRDGDAYFGKTVIVSARLAALADPGEVIASAAVRDLLPSDRRFRFGPARHVQLKGVQGSHVVYRLVC